MKNYPVGGFYRFTRVYIFLFDRHFCVTGDEQHLEALSPGRDGHFRSRLVALSVGKPLSWRWQK
ncbi:putative DUF2235 domain-containing protein [Pseudomonas sp. IT-P100]